MKKVRVVIVFMNFSFLHEEDCHKEVRLVEGGWIFLYIYHYVIYLMKVSSLSFVHRKGILPGIWGLVVSYINIFEDWICAILIEYISFHYLKNNGKYSYDYPRKEPTKLWITSTETYSLSVWDLVQLCIIIFLFY